MTKQPLGSAAVVVATPSLAGVPRPSGVEEDFFDESTLLNLKFADFIRDFFTTGHNLVNNSSSITSSSNNNNTDNTSSSSGTNALSPPSVDQFKKMLRQLKTGPSRIGNTSILSQPIFAKDGLEIQPIPGRITTTGGSNNKNTNMIDNNASSGSTAVIEEMCAQLYEMVRAFVVATEAPGTISPRSSRSQSLDSGTSSNHHPAAPTTMPAEHPGRKFRSSKEQQQQSGGGGGTQHKLPAVTSATALLAPNGMFDIYPMSSNHQQQHHRAISGMEDSVRSTGSAAPGPGRLCSTAKRHPQLMGQNSSFILGTSTMSMVRPGGAPQFTRYNANTETNDDGMTVIAEYEIVAELGRGSFGTVCLAFNNKDEPVAIKTMHRGTRISGVTPSPRAAGGGSKKRIQQSTYHHHGGGVGGNSSGQLAPQVLDQLAASQCDTRTNIIFRTTRSTTPRVAAVRRGGAAGGHSRTLSMSSNASLHSDPTRTFQVIPSDRGETDVCAVSFGDTMQPSDHMPPMDSPEELEGHGETGDGAVVLRSWLLGDSVTSIMPPILNKDLEAQQLVEREIAVMKALRHKNIVQLYAVIEDDAEQQCHLVMQYIENGPMAKMESDGSCDVLSVSLAVNYMCQVSAGLDYLHRHGIIHRDIKPENILIGKGHTAYVADFGMSGVISDMRGGASKTAGTMAFFSPEMFNCDDAAVRYGKESDVWAFGVSLYCITVGTLPFKGFNGPSMVRAIMAGEFSFPPALSQEQCPEALRDVIRKLLNPDPEKRMTLREFRRHPFSRQFQATWAGPGRSSPSARKRNTVIWTTTHETPSSSAVEIPPLDAPGVAGSREGATSPLPSILHELPRTSRSNSIGSNRSLGINSSSVTSHENKNTAENTHSQKPHQGGEVGGGLARVPSRSGAEDLGVSSYGCGYHQPEDSGSSMSSDEDEIDSKVGAQLIITEDALNGAITRNHVSFKRRRHNMSSSSISVVRGFVSKLKKVVEQQPSNGGLFSAGTTPVEGTLIL